MLLHSYSVDNSNLSQNFGRSDSVSKNSSFNIRVHSIAHVSRFCSCVDTERKPWDHTRESFNAQFIISIISHDSLKHTRRARLSKTQPPLSHLTSFLFKAHKWHEKLICKTLNSSIAVTWKHPLYKMKEGYQRHKETSYSCYQAHNQSHFIRMQQKHTNHD